MKKLLAAFLAAVTLTLAGCGAEKSVELNIDDLAADLAAGIVFEDELSLIDDGMVPMLYEIEAFEDAAVYTGSGATAEEIAVFACKDSDTAKAALEKAKYHITLQISSYADYIPEEVKRLEEAIVRQEGRYVIVVVTADTGAAEEILAAHLK